MARTVKDAKLGSRETRLTETGKDAIKVGLRYYKSIHDGLALSYRRPQQGSGVWSVRIRQPSGRYALERIGVADDYADRNGQTILSFKDAQHAALARMHAVEKAGGIIHADSTVSEACKRYMEWFTVTRKGAKETQLTIDAHIIPNFGNRTLASLKTAELRDWLQKLASTPARKRAKMGKPVAHREEPKTEDGRRARKATANRILTVFKAILNRAFEDELVASRDAWTRVKPFKGADQPVVRYLTNAEATRLVNACSADLRALVQAALMTGARFTELASMVVSDFAPTTRVVYIRPGKSGKGRHVPLNDEATEYFKDLAKGKVGADRLFTRADGSAWGRNHQVRPLLVACRKARVRPAITFHELRHTYASLMAQAGADLLTISKLLGHADTRITARHYAHLCDKTLANAVNALLPTFGAPPKSNVAAIESAG